MRPPARDIVLATLNARWAHASFGLRYLMANLGELHDRAVIREFDIVRRPIDVAEEILAERPRIVGLGVYIWNAEPSLQLAAILKRVAPEVILVLGGPEVSFETDQQPICQIADYVITGEADLAFAELCRTLLAGRRPASKIIAAELPRFSVLPAATTPPPVGQVSNLPPRSPLPAMATPSRPGEGSVSESGPLAPPLGNAGEGAPGGEPFPMAQLEGEAPAEPSSSGDRPTQRSPGITNGAATLSLPGRGLSCLPYHLYTADDLAHRVVYVEASRGCPFACEFCLSSLDIPVRAVPLETFLPAMQDLLDRGCLQFKFVDRTFNLNVNTSIAILQFFLDRLRPRLFLHFEMIPDRLPDPLRQIITRFPPGTLQFEVGVQTFNEDVAARIGRRQDNAKVETNLKFLKEQTGVHVHADLIVGLPGESLESFAAGFDRLLALGVQEIQVGILKRLRGTPISRHDAEWSVSWSPHAPYEILHNRLIDFPTMQKLRRFARYWDLLANSGNFSSSLPMIWRDRSPFAAFWDFSSWLYDRTGQSHAIALNRLAELLFEYLTMNSTSRRGEPPQVAAAAIWSDYLKAGRREGPEFLRTMVAEQGRASLPASRKNPHPNPLPEYRAREKEDAAPAGPPRQSRHRGRPAP